MRARTQVHQPGWREVGVPAGRRPGETRRAAVGRFLFEYERSRIADLLRVDTKIREISRQVVRSSVTISSEANRDSDADGVYHPDLA